MIYRRIQFFRLHGIILTLLLTCWLDTGFASQGCDKQGIVDLAGLGIGGTATLCNSNAGLKAHVRAEGLMPGEAYTVWWIYVDNPSACANYVGPPGFECEGEFFINQGDPLSVLGRLGSGVAPGNGKIHFKDEVKGLQASSGSVVWLFIMAHGEASDDGRERARQLLTPEDAFFGAPHLGIALPGAVVAIPAASSFHAID